MNLNIKKATEMKMNNATYLLYGAPGLGKTSTAKYFKGKTLILDIDRTTRVLSECENIDILQIDNKDIWKHWGEVLPELVESYKDKYDNIVLDNISELERCLLANLGREGKNNRVPSIANYQQVQFFLVDSIRFLKSLNTNLIITAWETTDTWTTEDGQQYNRAYPQINGKIMNNIMGLCDVVGRLFYNSTTEKRGVFLQPTNAIFAKNQLDDRPNCLQNEFIVSTMDTKNVQITQLPEKSS